MNWQVYCCCSWRGCGGGSGSGKTLLRRSAKYYNSQAFSDVRKGTAFYCVPTKVRVSRLFPCLLKSTGQPSLGLLNPSCAFPSKLVRTRGEMPLQIWTSTAQSPRLVPHKGRRSLAFLAGEALGTIMGIGLQGLESVHVTGGKHGWLAVA